MEQPNHIDSLFRQRLQQAEVPPPDFVWSNVEQALRRRKRRAFFWLFALGLGSLSIWAYWTLNAPAQADNLALHQSAKPSETVPAPVTAGSKNSAAERAAESTPVAPAADRPEEKQTLLTPKSAKLGAPKVQPLAQRNQTESRSKTTGKPTTNAELPAAGTEQNMEMAATPEAVNKAREGAQLPEQSELTANNFEEIIALPAALSLVERADNSPELKPIALPALKKKAPKKCYDFHTNRQAWLFDAYAGPSFVHKRLDTGNPEFKSYVQDRFATEKRDWAYHAGLRASYLFAENFIVRTGLHYEQFVEQFEYIDPNFIKYNIVITQKLINGQWVSVTDTTDIQYGANYVKTYNRFSLLDIPLQAALELRSGPTGVSLNLGGSINLMFKKRGSILTLDGKPADLQQFDIFQPKVGLSLLGSIQWFYHLTPRTRVFAEPYYRHILEPVSRAGYPVEQSYGIGGIRLGLTKIFD